MNATDFREWFVRHPVILMEGALSERLKREYGLMMNPYVTMAQFYRSKVEADALKALWNQYADIARRYRFPLLTATPTRRTNQKTLADSYCTDEVIAGNVALLRSVQQHSGIEMAVGGQMGSKGNAYTNDQPLTEQESLDFHRWTVERFARTDVDYLYPSLIPSLPEAAGIARAIDPTGLPFIISFTIRPDGRLIDSTAIADAIRYIDSITINKPVCYMANCVHPRFVKMALTQPFNQAPEVRSRFCGIQANAAPMTFEELDASPVLLTSAPQELAEEMMQLAAFGQIRIWGGCCGTDSRHMECIAKSLRERFTDA